VLSEEWIKVKWQPSYVALKKEIYMKS
jgi:hypothetical protein